MKAALKHWIQNGNNNNNNMNMHISTVIIAIIINKMLNEMSRYISADTFVQPLL